MEQNHSEREHALLSPSSSSRWLNCTPSARLAENAENKSSVYAEEGTLFHEICEYCLAQWNAGVWEPDPFGEELPELKDDHLTHPLFKQEMFRHARNYCDFVMNENYNLEKSDGVCKMLLEEKVDISEYAPECFGSVDCQLVGRDTLIIIDLKYGEGVKVYAERNTQMMLYALGAIKGKPSIKTIRLVIAQVRLNHFDVWEISANDLLQWADKVLKPTAKKAFAGKGEQKMGDWCGFCPVKAQCRKQYEAVVNDFDRYEYPELLTEDEICDLIEKIDKYKGWLESVNKFVYDEALRGHKWKGYKLVAGRSSRVITDEEAIRQDLLTKKYLEDEIFNIKLKGIGDLEKLVGKKQFSALYGQYVKSKPGNPKLVPDSAPGDEINPLSDFDIES
nr:MAG TPA: Protein of unknown function (DUF2800) [Caudoviricetes sp.]